MADEMQVYVIAYDVGNPRKTLIIPGGAIRSGGSKVFSALPVAESILKSIKGVTISKTTLSTAKDFIPPHPKAKFYEAVKAAHKKK